MSRATARNTRIETWIGPAWQASCTCGWEGRKYWTKGARRAANGERWQHQFDHDDVNDTHHIDG